VTARLFAFVFVFVFGFAQSALADCRDESGEPIACTAAPPPEEHTHRERESGYVNVYPFLELGDLSGVRFAPDSPSSVPEVERGSHLTGLPSNFDNAFGGLTLGVGYRPVPWLRLPDVSVSWGYGDLRGANVGIEGGAQALTGTVHDVWLVRAQAAAGFDLDLDPVRLYALGHVGVAGYFAQVEVGGSSIGGLGSDTYSAVSLELGWTLGMEIELAPEISYTLGYRHVHTGVEQNTFFFGVNARF
jgi:hypothetical protein